MRKLPAFVLAAATVLTVAGVPMTAQAATCPTAGYSSYLTNCSGQTGNINSILNQLGCTNGSSNCYSGSTKGSSCTNNSSCYSNKSSNSCYSSAGTNSCKTASSCWR